MSVLKYPPEFYTPYALYEGDVMTDREMRAEYSRLRTIANKRIAALGRSMWKGSEAYRQNRHGFPALKNIDAAEVGDYLADLARFIRSDAKVTVFNQKMKSDIAALAERNFFLRKDQYLSFISFMEFFRSNFYDRLVSSDQAVDYFLGDRDGDVDPWVKQAFEDWEAEQGEAT